MKMERIKENTRKVPYNAKLDHPKIGLIPLKFTMTIKNFTMQQILNRYDIFLEDILYMYFMRKFSILFFLLLMSCNSLIRNEDSIKKIADEAIDEEIDECFHDFPPYKSSIRRT